ncbi:hypothetical protein [Rhizobium sp. FY34]|uniref:hypothetical protein n=1 Tax=Rhizobium sp. FY34 TaxID=2562309 RepID=UPI0010C0ADD2|nr:hypothetical protein [Rhizobium sp. FY34]
MVGQGEIGQSDIVALDSMMAALCSEIGSLVAELAGGLQALSAGRIDPHADARQDVDAWIGQIDRLGLDMRRAESLMARQIARLDAETGPLIALADQPPATRRSARFLPQLRRQDPQAERLKREQQVVAGLGRQLSPTDGLISILEAQQAFLKLQLPLCEARLDEALTCLKILADPKRRSGDDIEMETRIERLALCIDLLQDLTDLLIEAMVGVNLMVGKLRLDAQQRVLSISALLGDVSIEDSLFASEASLPRLAPLFARARRRLLSVGGVATAKLRLDEAFRRRMAGSRQARAG